MSDEEKPSGSSLYRGPSGDKRDKRERTRDREQGRVPEAHGRGYQSERPAARPRDEYSPPRSDRALRDERSAPRREFSSHAPTSNYDSHEHESAAPRAAREQRLYGVNACLASFAKRPEALRKVYLLEARIPHFKAVLAHCVKNKLGYRVVEEQDLAKLTGSVHHEGVCFDVLPAAEENLSHWLQHLPAGPCVAIWLDGVGNPHNLGAILRSAAHFGVAAVLLPKDDGLGLSGAAARVAEGGAEQVAIVRLGRSDNSVAQLKSAGFQLAATVVRGGKSLYKTKLPSRLVLVMGAEQIGVDKELSAITNLQIGIPGTGHVESLNVSAATAVLLSEWRRQQMQ